MVSKRQLNAIKNRDWSSKTQKENAKYVRAKLEMLGYNVPAYMKKGLINQEQLDFYKNRIMNKLEKIVEKERRSKMSPGERKREDRDKNPNLKILDKFNKFRKRYGDLDEVENYLGRVVGEGEHSTLSGIHMFLGQFAHIKGDIKAKDIPSLTKMFGYTEEDYYRIMGEKMSDVDLKSYSDVLKYYGFKDKEINQLAKKFNKANYKRQDSFMKILKDFKKGMDKYKESELDGMDEEIYRYNFLYEFERRIEDGVNSVGDKIDRL